MLACRTTQCDFGQQDKTNHVSHRVHTFTLVSLPAEITLQTEVPKTNILQGSQVVTCQEFSWWPNWEFSKCDRRFSKVPCSDIRFLVCLCAWVSLQGSTPVGTSVNCFGVKKLLTVSAWCFINFLVWRKDWAPSLDVPMIALNQGSGFQPTAPPWLSLVLDFWHTSSNPNF